MKKIFIIFLSVLTIVSCKKEELPRPDNTVITTTQENYSILGVNWVLSEGRFYTENLDNSDFNYYNHFSGSQNQSTLDPINGADVPFDSILKDVTVWNFSDDNFTLNNGNSYNYTSVDNNISVVGLENGSSRPMLVLELTDTKMTVKIHEAYGSVNNENYYYFSTLTFIKQGETCINCQPNVLYGYVYGGVITNTISVNDIIGTKWVVTKFYDGFANSYPNDTLNFVNGINYTINNGTPYNYTVSSIFGNNMSELTLYNFYTIGGDFSGTVPNTFVTNGEINSSLFTDIFNTNNDKLVWMIRVQ